MLIELSLDDFEYLVTVLDSYPEDSKEQALKDEIMLQAYEQYTCTYR